MKYEVTGEKKAFYAIIFLVRFSIRCDMYD